MSIPHITNTRFLSRRMLGRKTLKEATRTGTSSGLASLHPHPLRLLLCHPLRSLARSGFHRPRNSCLAPVKSSTTVMEDRQLQVDRRALSWTTRTVMERMPLFLRDGSWITGTGSAASQERACHPLSLQLRRLPLLPLRPRIRRSQSVSDRRVFPPQLVGKNRGHHVDLCR